MIEARFVNLSRPGFVEQNFRNNCKRPFFIVNRGVDFKKYVK